MLEIPIDRQSRVPIYRQISEFVKAAILRGEIPAGYRLPPERSLAQALKVNRTTVMNAYAELKADGLLHGRVGQGTSVLAPGEIAPPPAEAIQPLRWSDLTRGPLRQADHSLRDLLALSEGSGAILLSLGFPAPDLIPVSLLEETLAATVRSQGSAAFFYAPAEGVSSFRQALAAHMESRGVDVSPDEILVTSGAQDALDLIARVLIEPGDSIVVEEPTYLGALQVFRAAQARLHSVPVDGQGMRTDLLERILIRQSPKFIYTLPTFQNPTGTVMSPARRAHLLELAHRYRVPVVEDDIYGDLWYDAPPPPPLKALDRHGYVIYASSFSKALCPGLRVGWLAAPRPFVRHLVQAKLASDLQAPTLGQMVFEPLLRSGEYDRHVARVRPSYAARRNVMDEALREHARGWAEWTCPRGGFYVWCRLKLPVSAAGFAAEAAEHGISVLPGSACLAQESTESCIRLCFSYVDPAQIREGVARLARAARATRAHHHPQRSPDEATRPLL